MEYLTEYLKECLKFCCKKCIDDRKDSYTSTKIILPPSRKSSVNPGVIVPSTFTYLAQPGFTIPNDDNYNCLSLTVPTTVRRKHSSPSVLASTTPVQLRMSTSSLFDSTGSVPDATISIEEVDENWNNNTSSDDLWHCDSVPNIHNLQSPTRLKPMKRLSLVAMQAAQSRRSSMSSFDISKDEVDSDLYDSSEIVPDVNSNGRLCYSVNYEKDFEQLTVHVICAKSLWQHEQATAVHDSFVKVSLLPPHRKKGTKTSTATQRASQNPVYNERFTYDNILASTSETIHIKLSVFTFDKSSRKKHLGTIIHKLELEGAHKYSDTKIWKHLYSEGTKCGEKGNLMLTTRYQPSDNRLHLNVVKASQLAIEDQEKPLEGVYIKIALVGNGKVLQKNKTHLIQPAKPDVAFDESFTFTLPGSLINQCCLLVSVCGKTTTGKRRHIGYVSVGPPFFATGSGLEQWTKMLSMPYTSIGKWHSLSVWSNKDTSQHLTNECNMF